ncbi:MAG: FG-GAP-like repeat-containing protein [Planctomycetota bacterium]
MLVPLKSCALFCLMAPMLPAQQVDWIQNPANGKWYGVTYGVSTWIAGEALAASLGGHLATVRNATEQGWLQANLGGYLATNGLWIGYTDAAVEGQWVWSSGEPATYTNWFPGQPQGGVSENYATTGLGGDWRWHDAAATYPSVRPLLEVPSRPAQSWSWPSFVGVGSQPHYGAVADFDGDEDLDYASPNRNSGNVSIYANNGAGAFTHAQTIGGCGAVFSLVAADFNLDGRIDLAATDSNGRVLMLLQTSSSGVFAAPTEIASIASAHGTAAADLNLDGRPDLVVSSTGNDDRVRVLLAQSNGSFAIAQTYGPFFDEAYEPTLADLDGDQVLDLVVSGGGAGVALLRGTGGGAFTYLQTLASSRCVRVAATDTDGDGDLDLVVPMIDLDAVQVWRNQGSATFQLQQTLLCGDGPHWATAADLDGDGDQDIVVPANNSSTIHVLRNDGAGVMTQEALLVGQNDAVWAGCADVNNDGNPDILGSCRGGNQFSVHRSVRSPATGTAAPVNWATATAPPFLVRHSAAAASRPGELLLFGGASTTPLNDTWIFNGTTWTKQFPLANPAVRHDHALVHDSTRNETVLFGGRSLVYPAMPDTWVWDGLDWIRRFPPSSPPARHGHRMAFDAARNRVVLFGGRTASSVLADTWTWDGFDWTQHTGVGPAARFDHGLAYDSERQRVVLYGGDSGSGLLGDLWEWNGTAWAQRTGIAGGPGPVADFAIIWDAAARRTVVHGGRRGDGVTNAMFAWDGQKWLRLANSGGGPAARDGHVLGQVGGDAKLWLLGGSASAPLYGTLWQTTLPAFGRFVPFGSGCLGSGGVPSLLPVQQPSLGQNFVVDVQNPPVSVGLGVGVLGFSNTQWSVFPLPTQLTFVGMPDCWLRVEPATLWPFLGTGTTAQWSYAVPSNPQLVGASFYVQALLFDPLVPNPANTFLAIMTNALAGTVGY